MIARSVALVLALLGASQLVVADYDETLAYRYVDFSGAAYCCGMALGFCEKWNCYACKGDLTVTEIHNVSTQGRGFVGYDFDTSTIVVAFSGTDPLSIQDWIDDIDVIDGPPLRTSVDPRCVCVCRRSRSTTPSVTDAKSTKVHGHLWGGSGRYLTHSAHTGFYDTYLSVRGQVHAAITSYTSQYKATSIEVTGHSLGAALAQHCALDLVVTPSAILC
jgi:hypothetical protein